MSWEKRIMAEIHEESADYESVQHRIRLEYPKMADRLNIRDRAAEIWRTDRRNGLPTKWSRAYEIALKEYTADQISKKAQETK